MVDITKAVQDAVVALKEENGDDAKKFITNKLLAENVVAVLGDNPLVLLLTLDENVIRAIQVLMSLAYETGRRVGAQQAMELQEAKDDAKV
jgi:hypothetical protein